MLLSRNYPPSPALADLVARHYVFSATLPDDFEMVDNLLSETAFIRILVRGDWAGETSPGRWERPSDCLFFGSNSLPMRVRVRGPFHVVGIALRPCGWRCLFAEPAERFADTLMPLSEVWSERIAEGLSSACGKETPDQEIVAICEAAVERRCAEFATACQISEPIRRFERIARDDSTMPIAELAGECGVSERQLERLARLHFGQSPKAIMRRSRFLDMAAAMRGLGDPSEAELAALRYFDQSHLTREFRRFSGMTPAAFVKTPTPLLTAGLELRQERKAEALA